MMLLLRVAWKLEANRPDATAKKIGQDQKESKGQLSQTDRLPSFLGRIEGKRRN